MAILTQLDAGKGVDGIVDAAVVRDVATGHRRVGGIHDGVRSKGRDITLPQIEEGVCVMLVAGSVCGLFSAKGVGIRGCRTRDHGDGREGGQLSNPLLFCLRLQVFVLHLLERDGSGLCHTDIHQSAQQHLLRLFLFRNCNSAHDGAFFL